MPKKAWMGQGRTLYGPDFKKWKFKCPVCKGTQTAQDFADLGVDPKNYSGRFYFSCIGRFKKGSLKGLGSGEGDAALGCDYSSGGLFVLNKKFVIDEGDEKPTPVFAFSDEEGFDE